MPEDLSGQDLRGCSFAGLDLSGANFSYTDIRGADFSRALLRGANFRHARAGLPHHWAISFVMGSWLVAAISGQFSGLAGYLIALTFGKAYPDFTTVVASLTLLVVFFFITLSQGIGTVIFGFVVIVAVAFDFAVAFGVGEAITFTAAFAVTAAAAGAGAVSVSVVISGATAGAFAAAVAVTVAMTIAVATTATIASAIAIAVAGAIAITLLGAYMGWRAVVGDEKYALIRKSVMLLTTRGTSFRGADLTNADFTLAILKNTDFRNAVNLQYPPQSSI